MMKLFKIDKKGVAAIEFAILLPFLLIVLYGAFQVSTYVSAVRKVDNVVNDLAYILSREGNIATLNASTGVYSGGKTDLENIVKNTAPFIMYPYQTGLTNNQTQIEMSFYGLPQFSSVSCPGGTVAGIDNTSARLMWTHDYPPSATANILNQSIPGGTNGHSVACSDSICPLSCNNAHYNSVFTDSFGERATIIYPGQSFILLRGATTFETVLGPEFPGVGTFLPKYIDKVSAYAIRSRWVDGANGSPADNIVQSNELINSMQYCTDCNVAASSFVTTGGGTAMKAANPLPRQSCKPDALISNANGFNNNDANSGGCSFF